MMLIDCKNDSFAQNNEAVSLVLSFAASAASLAAVAALVSST